MEYMVFITEMQLKYIAIHSTLNPCKTGRFPERAGFHQAFPLNETPARRLRSPALKKQIEKPA